jgi:hypothetical protein
MPAINNSTKADSESGNSRFVIIKASESDKQSFPRGGNEAERNFCVTHEAPCNEEVGIDGKFYAAQ